MLYFYFFFPPQQVRGILQFIRTVVNVNLEQVPGTGLKLAFAFKVVFIMLNG